MLPHTWVVVRPLAVWCNNIGVMLKSYFSECFALSTFSEASFKRNAVTRTSRDVGSLWHEKQLCATNTRLDSLTNLAAARTFWCPAWQRKELLSELITGSLHLVSHREIDPKVMIAQANWKRVVERVLKIEIDDRVPASMVWQFPMEIENCIWTAWEFCDALSKTCWQHLVRWILKELDIMVKCPTRTIWKKLILVKIYL